MRNYAGTNGAPEIIVALMVGTMLLGGILGGILAIPLTAALRVIMFRYVWKKREV